MRVKCLAQDEEQHINHGQGLSSAALDPKLLLLWLLLMIFLILGTLSLFRKISIFA